MTAIQKYGQRYVGDLKAFAKAFAWSTVAGLPVFVHTLEAYFWLAYVFVIVLGALTIVVVAVVTAIFGSYLYKLAVYVAVVGYYASALWVSAGAPIGGMMNASQLIFVQVVFVFGLFYFIAERPQIAARMSKYLEGDGTAQAKMIAEERATLNASRDAGP